MSNRTCGKAGCRGIVRDDVCTQCGPRTNSNWQSDKWRGSRIERGYDREWQAVRAVVIEAATVAAAMAGRSPYPICELCDQPIDGVREIDVDHIVPFTGRDDPLRLSQSNLRVTHRACHMRHHGAGKGRGRVGAAGPPFG